MKDTAHFKISVPELGDIPDITQVSNAISDLEDALACATEFMDGTIADKKLTLVSKTRKTKRTSYYDGLSMFFTAPVDLAIGDVTSVAVDDLAEQACSLGFILKKGDTAIVHYDGTSFSFKYAPIPRDNSVTSTSSVTVATSYAVKTAYDKANEAFTFATSLCPYRVGDILTTTLPDNPATTWTGTTWQKIEGVYLKGSSEGEASKTTGGSNSKTLSLSNMPEHSHSASSSTNSAGAHTHSADHSHSASQSAHTHTANHNHSGAVGAHTHTANHNHSASQSAHAHTQPAHSHSFTVTITDENGDASTGNRAASGTKDITSRGWSVNSGGGDNTGSATPSVSVATANVTTSSTTPSVTINTTNVTTSSSTPSVTVSSASVTTSETAAHSHTVTTTVGKSGDGASFNVEPAYYTVHYWLRTA